MEEELWSSCPKCGSLEVTIFKDKSGVFNVCKNCWHWEQLKAGGGRPPKKDYNVQKVKRIIILEQIEKI
jgi:DNA-directed RNA polymerase subunit M/transcription elongation factor TFIIS